MIPDATEDDYERDAEMDYVYGQYSNMPWIRRAVAAEKELAKAGLQIEGRDNEIERLRAALEREYKRLQSLNRFSTHYDGCDGSQGHALCYAMRLIREALTPRTATPEQRAATAPPPNPLGQVVPADA